MDTNLWLALIGLAIAGLSIKGVMWIQRRRFVRNRPMASLDEIYATHFGSERIRFDVFRQVYEAIGRCYSLDPRLVMPTDRFDDFDSFDSFSLWHGKETLDRWASQHFAVTGNEHFETVADLVRFADRASSSAKT